MKLITELCIVCALAFTRLLKTFPTMPTGLDFYWVSTVVVSVIASPTMFEPSLTSFRSLSISPIATVPFTAHADLRDWYGNAIETDGINDLATNLSSTHCWHFSLLLFAKAIVTS